MAQDYGLLGFDSAGAAEGQALLGGGGDWQRALTVLGAVLQDLGAASQGRAGGALPALDQRNELDRWRREQAVRQQVLLGRQSARAALLGGHDPATGITWSTGRQLMDAPERQWLLGQAFPDRLAEEMLRMAAEARRDPGARRPPPR